MSVEELIPQRAPILMIDSVQQEREDAVRTTLWVTDDNLFVKDHSLVEAGLVEHAAQSAAALIGFQSIARNERPRIGYIGAVQDFTVYTLPHTGDRLQTSVQKLAEAEEVTLVEATVQANNQIIATGKLKLFITPS